MNTILIGMGIVILIAVVSSVGIYIHLIRESNKPKPPLDPRHVAAWMAIERRKPVFWSEETGYVVMGEEDVGETKASEG